ncbi:MAG: hypothetical protein A2X49_12200 [Lentisphaerae bacterium GWF2_52_8]|nr:MAG: hypothetical protein A2X49_12200 [Lentisphaerae bacterium GWF2_52_8]
MSTIQSCPSNQPLKLADPVFLEDLITRVCATYEDSCGINHIEGFNLPQEAEILEILHDLLELVFPGFSGKGSFSLNTIRYSIGEILVRVYPELVGLIARSFHYNCKLSKCCDCNVPVMAESATKALLNALPEIRKMMKTDTQAAYDGDPAARSLDEIVMSYPGIKAITIQRLAHVLYSEKVPLLPRLLTEYAHRITGIDIHPGAKLGTGIFIDHGTGVVVGETAILGDNVKLYQGVTLGALSFPKDACGKIIKGAKRHPTIENDVTIYAGATILGDIVIGRGSVIGGNVWLTETVGPGTKITIAPPDLTIKKPKSI